MRHIGTPVAERRYSAGSNQQDSPRCSSLSMIKPPFSFARNATASTQPTTTAHDQMPIASGLATWVKSSLDAAASAPRSALENNLTKPIRSLHICHQIRKIGLPRFTQLRRRVLPFLDRRSDIADRWRMKQIVLLHIFLRSLFAFHANLTGFTVPHQPVDMIDDFLNGRLIVPCRRWTGKWANLKLNSAVRDWFHECICMIFCRAGRSCMALKWAAMAGKSSRLTPSTFIQRVMTKR